MRNKKGLEAMALTFNMLTAIPIIVISLLILYAYLGGAAIDVQQSSMKGYVAKLQFNSIVADWAMYEPDTLTTDPVATSPEIAKKFTEIFTEHGYRVSNIKCYTRSAGYLQCEYTIQKGERKYSVNHGKKLYVTHKAGIYEAAFIGEIYYE